MPTHKQGTVTSPVTDKDLGRAGSTELQAIFATSPIYAGDISPDSIREDYQATVLDGEINDGGHTFGTFQPDYSGAPNMADVETGGGGAPASAFVPNPSSPGQGSTSPTDQPEAPDGFGLTPSATPFAGVGSQLDPQESSAAISGQTLGDYGFGKSS